MAETYKVKTHAREGHKEHAKDGEESWGRQAKLRLCRPNTGGSRFVLIVCRWAIVILSTPVCRTCSISAIVWCHVDQGRLFPRERSCSSRSWWSLWTRRLSRLVCRRIQLRRRSRPRGGLISVRVHVRVRSVPRTRSAIWDDVVSVPRPSESVGTLRPLSRSLRVRILERVLLGVGTVRVDQILVTS